MKVLKQLIPDSLKSVYRLRKARKSIFNDFLYDYRRFVKFSGAYGLKNKDIIEAHLIKEYHAIEKGLALPSPRPGFASVRIGNLIEVLKRYILEFGSDSVTDTTISALKEYLKFDTENNIETNPVKPKIEDLINSYSYKNTSAIGGTKLVKKFEIISSINFDYSSFVKSRFSTRDFSGKPVDTKMLMSAIEMACFTPSVCNRQPWKVYIIEHDNKDLKRKFLNVQNGNKGFGEYISTLLIVTGRLSSFFSYERNQVFIDGGMFSMALVLALHSMGLGTCCLNTSYTSERCEEFLKISELEEDCVPIMFIAVGHLKDEYKVANSVRKPISEVAEILK